MRLSIRDQILLPLILIQVAAIGAMTWVAAALTARRVERQVFDRLDGVVESLRLANFPYTPGVLARMRGLSGAEFVAYAPDGRVTATSLARFRDEPPPWDILPGIAQAGSLGDSPVVAMDGVRYFALPIRSEDPEPTPVLLALYPEASLSLARREAAVAPLLLGAGSLGLIAGVTCLIARRIGRRLRGVTDQVARIAGGDFRGFDPGPGRDEVDDLARSVNAMCDQLRALTGQIQRSERARLLAQLGAGLAHQLRNSLTGARMSIQLHARRHPPPADDRSLEVALRQLAMTEEQVRGLLSLGHVEPRPPAPCDLRGLLEEVALLVGPACGHARVALEVRGDGPPSLVMAEESGLRAAILNLTLNAIEAAGPGGSVWLELSDDGESVAIQVRDSGTGPPSGLSESLFEPFATSKPEGVGLGLALAQQVAARHGGALTWTQADGETRFRLTVPKDRVAGEAVA